MHLEETDRGGCRQTKRQRQRQKKDGERKMHLEKAERLCWTTLVVVSSSTYTGSHLRWCENSEVWDWRLVQVVWPCFGRFAIIYDISTDLTSSGGSLRTRGCFSGVLIFHTTTGDGGQVGSGLFAWKFSGWAFNSLDLVCPWLKCKIKMNLLLVVVEHPAGNVACLHCQDNCLHQVAGSLEDQVAFRHQSKRRHALVYL